MLKARWWMIGLCIGFSFACDEEKPVGDTGTLPPIPASEMEICGEHSPVIEDLVVENYGMYTFGEGSMKRESPSIRIGGNFSDDDGDLHICRMRVWFDQLEDGNVSTVSDPLEVHVSSLDDSCIVFNKSLGMILEVGTTVPFDTLVEFGVVASDAEGNRSDNNEPTLIVFTTPDEDGND
jgi:hypothetical protein